MRPRRDGTFQPRTTADAHNGPRHQPLFLGEPPASTANVAVRTGLGSIPFAARRIPRTAHCCYVARQFTRQTVRQWNVSGICDDAVQIASELVANAVRHGRPDSTAESEVQSAVWLAFALRPRTLLCVVRDPSLNSPRLTLPQPLAERHRGLPIVNALSNTWGWTTTPQAQGKSVWARVALPAA
ncbi:ATP-binding protein [Streptomyces sp. NPDC090080]|jgi:anti-sigma regulatory factor (Ser/Thr protein kinase)|uniref:ATP-binding protein n=1 Tax=Streptomyces sp. NPDC090080 TaxID=3365939 RepID=UPI00382BCB1A